MEAIQGWGGGRRMLFGVRVLAFGGVLGSLSRRTGVIPCVGLAFGEQAKQWMRRGFNWNVMGFDFFDWNEVMGRRREEVAKPEETRPPFQILNDPSLLSLSETRP